MRRHKIRSLLALFGIVWGTVAVMLLLAIGRGFSVANKNNLMDLSSNAVMIYTGVTSKSYQGFPAGQAINISSRDVLLLPQQVPGLQYFSPVISSHNQKVSVGDHTVKGHVEGVTPDWVFIRNYQLAANGRFINNLDVDQHQQVIVIEYKLAQHLFGTHSALGKQVNINGVPFTVIGIFNRRAFSGQWYSNLAAIPYTTAIDLWGDQSISQIVATVKNSQQLDLIKQQIKNYFAERYGFDPTDPTALYVFNAGEFYEFINWFFLGIEIFLGFCGVMTLCVGGIGVANIMYLIISERTAEIGLRMALGAEDKHILWQILLESVVIVTAGAIIGLIVATIILVVLHWLPLPEWLGQPTVSPIIGLVTVVVLAIIGLLAGYFPAKRAAKLQPVAALASE